MFEKNLKRKYALSNAGVSNIKKGMLWTVIVNFVVMGGMGILYMIMDRFMKVYTGKDGLGSPWIIILLTVAFLVLSLITHIQQYKATYGLVYGEVKTMRIGLAEKLRKLPLAFFGNRDLADLTETIMGDVNRMEHVWSHVLGYLYGSYISTAVIATMLFVYDWRLAIACLWGVPVAFGLLFGSKRISQKGSVKVKEASLSVSDGMQETIENVREIHATNQEEKYLKNLDNQIDSHEKSMLRGELVLGLFVNGASVIMRLGIATTILVGANLVLSGSINFMILFMFLLVITRIYAPFDQSLVLIAELFISEVSAKRLMEIYDTDIATGNTEFKPKGYDIEFDNVTFSYENENVLDQVSFVAREGEVTALVGPSGSGKSTCARLSARLWDVDSGTIHLGKVDINTVEPETLLQNYSMVFQDVVLFDDTIMENIRLGRHNASDKEVIAAAKSANCEEFINNLPDGYNTIIGENGTKLSGGERQRISIARALLKDAPVVLLDEATASLDVENETKVQGAISKLLTNKTVLVIAHRMRTIENADKIIVLKEGRIVEEGKPEVLLKKESGLFKQMRFLQSENSAWGIE